MQSLRLASLFLVVLAACGLAIELPVRSGTVVVVADRSSSMPQNSDVLLRESIELIQKAMGSDDRLGVVSFGRSSAIERVPQSGPFAGFINDVGPHESNLSDGIEKALALIPREAPGRVIVLSDGKWTGKDPVSAATRAAARGVQIDYRTLQRDSTGDVAISQFDAPNSVTPGESFMITAWVRSPVQQEIAFELSRGGRQLASGKRLMSSGLNRLTFRDQSIEAGTHSYSLRLTGAGEDPVPENNLAKLLVGIEGPKPLLFLAGRPDSSLSGLLKAGGLNVRAATPESISWSLEDLSNYSAALLENVPAEKIGTRGMENIAAWVKETGAGLMMTGGKNAYGPGGYFRSPIEPILPVSMELRREHRKLALAIVVAMDRSGSMSAPVPGGRTKMDLANVAAVQVLDLLSPMDEFGVIAVDSSPHIIADLAPAEDTSATRNRILRVDSGGGGIFIYEALSAAAGMMVDAKAGTRHIILFADAADSEEPGKYKDLIEECRKAGMTISVIGLGSATDTDAGLLQDIAKRGGGQCYFTANAEELPRLFAQDTFLVARSSFLDEPTPIKFTGGLISLFGSLIEETPTIGGYNLCYLRPEANMGAVTTDEYNAPIVSNWQAGIGRVICYTGEAGGSYTGPIAQWKETGNLFTSMARWAAGESNTLAGSLLVTQEVKNGAAVLQLHLDPERESEPFADLPRITTLRGTIGSAPAVEKSAMRWVSPDTLEAVVPLGGTETALSTVEVTGAGRMTVPPVCLPYSPEFRPIDSSDAALSLEGLAKATGGKQRADLASIWNDLPKERHLIDLTPWLLALSVTVFLLEIIERRTGLLSLRGSRITRDIATAVDKARPHFGRRARPARPTPLVTDKRVAAGEPQPVEDAAPAASDQSSDLVDALSRARRRAKDRTKSPP